MLQFLQHIRQSIDKEIFVRLTLSHPSRKDNEPKKIIVRFIMIKDSDHLSFTLRYNNKDITKNYTVSEGLAEVQNLLENTFQHARLFTIEKDYLLEKKKNNILLRENQPEFNVLPERTHNRKKEHTVTPDNKEYLMHLGLTDTQGKVRPKLQDKFRQINQYISILKPKLQLLANQTGITVADMGSGKGYLTFALYDYLRNTFDTEIRMTGVEMRTDLVEFCNATASKCQFSGLKFVQNTIEEFTVDTLDLLVALHACDTATDEAIAKGITAGAKIIVVAPCCHHQIRKDMEKSKTSHPIESITQYGIFLERQAEMITDAIRAHVLEYFGYKVSICEFIADAHTHKNILIIAEQSEMNENNKLKASRNIIHLKKTFGIEFHALEKLLQLNF